METTTEHTLPDTRNRRIALLTNPLSGKYEKKAQAFRTLAAEHKQNLCYEVRTPVDVASALTELAAKEVHVLAVHGGDGTVQAVLTVLFNRRPFQSPPPLAVLAGGTTNMTASDIGTTGSPVRLFQRLLAWAKGHEQEVTFVKRPVMRVESGLGTEPQFGMFFSAAGIVEATIARWEARDRTRLPFLRGALGTALTALGHSAGLLLGRRVVRPSRIEVRLDNGKVEASDYLALLVTTLRRLAVGIRPYWGNEPRPLHYTAVADQPTNLFLAAPGLLLGRPNRHLTPARGYISHNVNDVWLRPDGPCALDGQILNRDAAQPIQINGDHSVYFIRA